MQEKQKLYVHMYVGSLRGELYEQQILWIAVIVNRDVQSHMIPKIPNGSNQLLFRVQFC